MSQKNEIDELFRRGLGDKGLDYTPEYWEQMEALIGKRKRRMVKRGIWLSAVLLLCVSGIFLATREGKQNTAQVENQPSSYTHTPDDKKTTPSASVHTHTGPVEKIAERKVLTGQKGKGHKATYPVTPEKITPSSLPYSQPKIGSAENKTPAVEKTPVNTTPVEVKPVPHPLTSSSLHTHTPALLFIQPLVIKRPEYTMKTNIPTALENDSRRPPSFTQWYLGSFFNYGRVKHRTDDPAIRSWKAANEKTLPFSHYGLNTRIARGHLSLSLGAGIRQWTERTNYQREVHHYTFDTSLQLVTREFVQRPDGTYAALIRQKIDTTSHTTSNEVFCRDCPVEFRYVTIPVALQYEFARGRWSYFTGAGLTFSMLSKGSGEYSVQWDRKTPGMRTGNAPGTSFSKMVVQAGLTLGFKFRLLPSLSVGGHFDYQGSVSSMMQQYRQQTDFYGVGLGLEWKL